MASAEPRMTHIGKSGIRFIRDDPEAVLGSGGFGIVFKGWMNERKVAIKQIFLQHSVGEEREVKLQKGLDHENVLKILKVEKDDKCRYIVLELCAGTLTDFINGEYTGQMPLDEEVLYQIASGVHYIHSMQLIHRDIKPDNILISCTSPVVMKVSDFGLSKATSSRGTCSVSRIMGTLNWMAQEVLILNSVDLKKERGSVQSDVFALGCVFFYFVTRGIHPFGEDVIIPANIVQNNPVKLKELPKEHFAYGLITKMILHNSEERIALTKVIEILEDSPKFQFKAIERYFPQISGRCVSRFHPTEPVLACGSEKTSSVILLKGANGSIPFSNWEIKQEFIRQTKYGITRMEWNVNGTQLAAGCFDGTVIVWSYPSGDVFFEEEKHSLAVGLIAWNPFRQDVLATLHGWENKLLICITRENAFFLTMERDDWIKSVAWISANQIAIGLGNGEIEISKIDDDKGTSHVVKRFTHSEEDEREITDLQWNERTKYLASCSWDDGWIKIWSMDSDQPVHSLELHSDCRRFAWRRNVKTDDDGNIDAARKNKENFNFACALYDGSIVIWNPLEEDESNRKRILPQKHLDEVDSLSFSPDCQYLASRGQEVTIWFTETWLPVFTCKSNGWNLLSWMSTDSSSVQPNKLAVISKDKIVVIEESFFFENRWKCKTTRCVRRLMASAEPRMTHIGKSGIRFIRNDPEAVLGKGGFGRVYKGWMNEMKVAIKRIPIVISVGGEREVKLQSELDHENVLKILKVEKDDDIRYIVLELCAGTLTHFINGKYKGPMPTDREVLNQMASGVYYIHSKKLIHRDIKPDNILISLSDPVVMKVSDFGLSKLTSSLATCSVSGTRGTHHWMAPEMLSLSPEELDKACGSVQSDVFALGCVFFYFTTRGIHPFGLESIEEDHMIYKEINIFLNIIDNNPVNLNDLSKVHYAYGLITKMILHKKEERIALTKVIEILENSPKFQFKAIERFHQREKSGCYWSRFHPTDPVLACRSTGSSSVFILKGANGSIPFSNWEIEQKFKGQTRKGITALEWNMNGTQLAAGYLDGTVIVWSYPSGRVLFEENKHSKEVVLIAWNPFRQDVLATRQWDGRKELLFWNSRKYGNGEKTNHFLTLKREGLIWSVAWISANQIAIGLKNGWIEIYQICEDKGTSRVVKRFRHSRGREPITGLQWNERTKYLASSSWNDEWMNLIPQTSANSSLEDKWIKIWSMDSDQPVHTLQVNSRCLRLAWRRNGKTDNDEQEINVARKDKENLTMTCGLYDGSILIWNPLEEDEANRKRILHKTVKTHLDLVISLLFSPDGRFLASTDSLGELIIWSTDETWLPVFTCKIDFYNGLSWMPSNSSSVQANKLAVQSYYKVLVLEESSTE